MTRDQFDDWLDKHVAHFPGVSTWLGKFAQPQSDAVLAVWFEHLKACELADCLEATTALFDQAGRAPHYERHPQAIRGIIREKDAARAREEPPRRFVDGEQLFECLLCHDDGWVRCWHPKTVAAAADGTLGDPFTVYTCVVPCSCQAGERFIRSGHATYLPRYNPERWALVGDGPCPLSQTRDECWALIEALREKGPAQPAEKQGAMF
ncbi:MAG: hypothetical protein V3U39_12300 [Acidimicrobiia bacterium]